MLQSENCKLACPGLYNMLLDIKVRSLFKDGKQTARCTEFRTETGLCSLVSLQKFVHPAVCLPSLKRERTLVQGFQLVFTLLCDFLFSADFSQIRIYGWGDSLGKGGLLFYGPLWMTLSTIVSSVHKRSRKERELRGVLKWDFGAAPPAPCVVYVCKF